MEQDTQEYVVQTKHFNELGFTVVAKPASHYVEYLVYRHDAHDENEVPMFHRKGSTMSPDPVATLEEADVYMKMDVKWDGCVNWIFPEMQTNMYAHACSREELENVGKVQMICYDWTKEIIGSWDE